MLFFISDTDHYSSVLDLVTKARETLWIGTADIKDLYVVQGKAKFLLFIFVVSTLLRTFADERTFIE